MDREIEILDEILASEELLNKYNFQKDNELQIMTLHKSKELEFKIVIHQTNKTVSESLIFGIVFSKGNLVTKS